MRLITPRYYRDFKCIAGKCGDSCCIGWGIYIDDETAEKYRGIGGEFGERLRKNIDFDGEQCFINDSRRRCPFLNEDNLCEIIIRLGEEYLCDICDRHPRYFEWFDDVIEGGIGLCCEEAARIILTSDVFSICETQAPGRLISGEEDEPCDWLYYAFLKSAREKIISLLTDESISLDTALDRLAAYAEKLQEMTDEYDIENAPEIGEICPFDAEKAADILSSAEPEDMSRADYWQAVAAHIKKSSGAVSPAEEDEKELRNIAVYFVWRYFLKAVFSGEVHPKLMLAVFGTRVIAAMFYHCRCSGKPLDIGEKCLLAKDFSKLIEYNEDNLDLIFGAYSVDIS